MASNGRLPKSELAPIPGGELRKDAAAAWNAPGGPADAGLRPTGSRSSYRTFAEQEYFWRLYQEGGALAAEPGTSNHGLGIAVDLAEPWMRDWIDECGAKFGWRKTEAMGEWWHVNFVGGVSFPTFKTLKHGRRGPRVVKFTRRLAFIRRRNGKPYLHRQFWKFKDPVIEAVLAFQKAYGLTVDGEIGPKTAAMINGVFKRQYRKRGK
jgi:Putative peptidoglycan binding domain/D-alanyl-D-alanine carboxypeptidase